MQPAGRPSQQGAARRSGTWRRWGSGRPSFRPSRDTTDPLRPKDNRCPRPSAELRGEAGEVGPRSASTLRLRLEKSPRVKHDSHQGGKNQYRRAGGGRAVPEGNVWQRRASFPHRSPQRDSCFLTRIGHQHPGSPPLRRPPRGAALPWRTSSGLGLPWVRSSTKFLSSGSQVHRVSQDPGGGGEEALAGAIFTRPGFPSFSSRPG